MFPRQALGTMQGGPFHLALSGPPVLPRELKGCTHLPLVVGAGKRLAGHGADRVQHGSGGILVAGTVGLALEHLHEVGDEEVVLEGGHTLLRQDRGLAAHRAGQG